MYIKKKLNTIKDKILAIKPFYIFIILSGYDHCKIFNTLPT